MLENSKRIRRITVSGIVMAIIIAQSLFPMLGYVPIGVINLTTIHITVIIVAILFGLFEGTVAGTTWGVFSFINAWTRPTSVVQTLVFTNPLVSIVPRIIVGIVAALIFMKLSRLNLVTRSAITALICSLLNTILVLGTIYLAYRTPEVAQAYGLKDPSLLGKLLLGVVGTNGIPEAILAAVVVPIIVKALSAALKNKLK
ncbi:ECF transporter S component [Liquorilactobacillus capillatus]|uniref:Integral membrane protein n=1 Tax=Liquorilactobacillus capillatus DSM 19910 TaxID=1423731 RepID=A0A0R1M8Q0_9LACO|nr:ECF transporter S component [Liquorilactobacillus capillatus]KRL01130.1 integral membrane protein [Liquorilactobacillus capillatus DSM 19910]